MNNHTPDDANLLATDVERIGVGVFAWLQGFLIALVPLLISKQFFFPFIVPRTAAFMIGVSLLVVNWAVLYYHNPERFRLPWKNPIILAVGSMLGVWTISGLLGADWVLSFWSTYQRMTGIMLLMYLFIWLLVTTAVLRKQKVWDNLLGVFVGTGLFVSLYTMFGPHGFAIAKGLDLSRGGATIGNTSFLGAYVLFTMFVALLFVVRHYQKTKEMLTWRILPLLIMIFSPAMFNFKLFYGDVTWKEAFLDPTKFLGQARAAVLSIIIGLVFALGLYLIGQRSKIAKLAGAAMSVGPAIAATAVLALLFRVGSKPYEVFGEMTLWSRYYVWDEALTIFKQRPLLGWGPESFDLLHQHVFTPALYTSRSSGELWFDRAHNIVIDTMASTGLLGILTYAAIFVALFYVLYKLRELGRVSRAEVSILGGMMFAYVLQNMTVFDMTVSYVAFFLILGYVAAKLPRQSYVEIRTRASQSIAGVVAVVAVIMIFVWPVRILNAAWSISQSIRSQKPALRMELYETAFELPMGRTLYLRTVATQMYETLRAQPELINPASIDVIQLEADFFEQALSYEAEARPYNYRAYITAAKMAQLQAYAGKPQKLDAAREYAQAAVAIAPQNPMAYITLYELAAMEGDWDQAEHYLTIMLAAVPESEFIQKSYNAAWSTIQQLRAGETPQNPPTIRF